MSDPYYVSRYFVKEEQTFKIKEYIKKMATFETANITDWLTMESLLEPILFFVEMY